MTELEEICAAPRKQGAILGVDNTFATPLNQRPLALGADVSVQSVTKFIGGHSDLLGGVVTVRDAALLTMCGRRENWQARHQARWRRFSPFEVREPWPFGWIARSGTR